MSRIEKIAGDLAIKIHKGFIPAQDINPLETDHSNIKKILIVLRHQMGDMLCALPMMRSVRNFYPVSEITLVTKKSTRFSEIFTGSNSPVDRVLNYESGFENLLNLLKQLRDISPDLAIVPSTVVFSATNHLIAYYSDARIRLGVRSMDYEKNKVSYLLNLKNDFLWSTKKIHQIERNLDIISQTGITPSVSRIEISGNENSDKFAEEFFGQNFPGRKPVIGIHPGAAKKENIWSAGNFADLAGMFSGKTGFYLYISEGPDDKIPVAELERILKSKYPQVKYAKYKGDLINNIALISKCALFVSNDTGIMHIAGGTGVPMAALFTENKAYEWGPIGDKKVSIQSKGGDINSIAPEAVYETCMRLLSV